jgi:hypothetical protein
MKTKSAWLVTWEWSHPGAAVEKKVAAIINYRRTGEQVRQLVEHIYMVRSYSPGEMARSAKDRSSNPYPAEFERINGVPWQGRIRCGHNPHLYARLVSNLRTVGTDLEDDIAWDERPFPRLPDPLLDPTP